jgi:predicted Zn-dependent peptidase
MTGELRLVADPPQPGAPRDWTFPAFERSTVAGGRVMAAHLPGRPLAVVTLLLEGGAATEPAGREGVSLLVARGLSEGTADKDAYAFAVAGERLGATWRADSDWDSVRCGFEVPSGELLAATELLAEAVRTPALTDEIVKRIREERLDDVRIDLSQPGPRAATAFAQALFAAGCRYARPDGGDIDSIAGLTPDDLRDFHAARFVPSAATLIVAGDLDGVDVEALGRAVFEGWSGEAPEVRRSAVEHQPSGRRLIVVDRPGSVQSMLYVGHEGPPRRTPDYVPMTTMALALGGMFNSRLNYRLREDKGYTYGAFGGFDCRRDTGVFVARAAVQSEVTVAAFRDHVAEIELMQADGLTAEELDRARSYRAGIFPINFAGPGAVASGLAEVVVHGHPDDHFDRLRAAILALGTDEVNAAAAERLHAEQLVAVVVGDAAAIREDLEGTGFGPVDVIRDEA